MKAKRVKPKRVKVKRVKAKRQTKESAAARKARAGTVYELLAAEYPSAHCELDFRSPFELVVATILSAQCTDKRVNMVTPALFARYPDAAALAEADRGDVEALIQSTGFFRNKAKSLEGLAKGLMAKHEGQVPATLQELVKLPGIGRKTANVVLGNAFGANEGVVVDTHIARLSQRLQFTKEGDPVKIEQDLMKLFPQDQWTMLAHLLIWHGRRICDARKPKCGACVVAEYCPSRQI